VPLVLPFVYSLDLEVFVSLGGCSIFLYSSLLVLFSWRILESVPCCMRELGLPWHSVDFRFAFRFFPSPTGSARGARRPVIAFPLASLVRVAGRWFLPLKFCRRVFQRFPLERPCRWFSRSPPPFCVSVPRARRSRLVLLFAPVDSFSSADFSVPSPRSRSLCSVCCWVKLARFWYSWRSRCLLPKTARFPLKVLGFAARVLCCRPRAGFLLFDSCARRRWSLEPCTREQHAGRSLVMRQLISSFLPPVRWVSLPARDFCFVHLIFSLWSRFGVCVGCFLFLLWKSSALLLRSAEPEFNFCFHFFGFLVVPGKWSMKYTWASEKFYWSNFRYCFLVRDFACTDLYFRFDSYFLIRFWWLIAF
jgi:hypothetical protein